MKDLKIDGYDLMLELNLQGKGIGALLLQLLDMVIANPSLNEKETLIELARKIQLGSS